MFAIHLLLVRAGSGTWRATPRARPGSPSGGRSRVPVVELLHLLVEEGVTVRRARRNASYSARVGRLPYRSRYATSRKLELLGDLLDRVAAVAEDPLVAVDEGDRAAAGPRVPVARVERDGPRERAELADVDADLPLPSPRSWAGRSPCRRGSASRSAGSCRSPVQERVVRRGPAVRRGQNLRARRRRCQGTEAVLSGMPRPKVTPRPCVPADVPRPRDRGRVANRSQPGYRVGDSPASTARSHGTCARTSSSVGARGSS